MKRIITQHLEHDNTYSWYLYDEDKDVVVIKGHRKFETKDEAMQEYEDFLKATEESKKLEWEEECDA